MYSDQFTIERDAQGFLKICSTIVEHGKTRSEVIFDHSMMKEILKDRPEQAIDKIVQMSNIMEQASYDTAINYKTRYATIEKISKSQMNKYNPLRRNAFHLSKKMYKRGLGNELWSYGERTDTTTDTTKSDKEILRLPTSEDQEDLSCFTIENIPATGNTSAQKWICVTDTSGNTLFYNVELTPNSTDTWRVINK
jgi:hypothetical protein